MAHDNQVLCKYILIKIGVGYRFSAHFHSLYRCLVIISSKIENVQIILPKLLSVSTQSQFDRDSLLFLKPLVSFIVAFFHILKASE